MAKLHSEKTAGVLPNSLKKGCLAVIVKWPADCYIGEIVQRHEDTLIGVGTGRDMVWDNIYYPNINDGTCLLRVLEAGELIEVTKND
jgi:hypothetical protein